MDDKLGKIVAIAFVFLTMIALLISGLGLFEDDRPSSSGAASSTEESDEEKPPVRSEENAPKRAPRSIAVTATWKMLEREREAVTEDARTPLPQDRLTTRLPALQGRLIVRTPADTGGVRSIVVVDGTPLAFDPATQTPESAMFRFKGAGRDIRVVAITLVNGERLLRVLRAETLGKGVAVIHVTKPAALLGRIVDRANQPIEHAAIEIDGKRTLTDKDGRFGIQDVRGPRAIGYVTKEGFALYRAEFETPRSFGDPQSPHYEPVLTLQPGVTLTIRCAPECEASDPFFVYLVPHGYQLTDRHLAVERMGPIKVAPGAPAVFPHLPTSQTVVAIATHPKLSFDSHRLDGGDQDQSIVIANRPWRRVVGDVTDAATKGPVAGLRVETSLDDVVMGAYLVAMNKIPSALQTCSYPLPRLSSRLLRRGVGDDIDDDRRFDLTFDANTTPTIRVSGKGFVARTFRADALRDKMKVVLGAVARRDTDSAQVTLKVAFAGQPEIASFECEGAGDLPSEVQGNFLMVYMKSVQPGRYRLRIRAPGFIAYQREVRIGRGSQRVIPAFLNLE